ncbi:hypothetical protein LTS18_002027, partial [Coniosporium uncinatum]
ILGEAVEKCLESNSSKSTSHIVFERLKEVRADFAFVILQRLISSKSAYSGLRQLFTLTWNTIVQSRFDYDAVFTTESAPYYRTLLKILVLSAQPHLQTPAGGDAIALAQTFSRSTNAKGLLAQTPLEANLILEVLDCCVARGFRSLATALHDSSSSSENASIPSPADFVLLTSLLHTLLSIPGTHTLHTSLTLLFTTTTNTLRYATALFSHSDRFLTPNNDPVYGSLSLSFLLELSSVLPLAEAMAVDNVLASLSSANLAEYFLRPAGMGPFDEPARIY